MIVLIKSQDGLLRAVGDVKKSEMQSDTELPLPDASDSDALLDDRAEKKARDQTILVYLLLFLHILFGITALIGVIICHTKKSVTENSVYESHRVWQTWTFWTGLIGYAAGFYYINFMGSWTILIITIIWVIYRISKGWALARSGQPINPGFAK